MKRNGQITAFYLETLLLIVVFIAIILVLTQVFGLAQLQRPTPLSLRETPRRQSLRAAARRHC